FLRPVRRNVHDSQVIVGKVRLAQAAVAEDVAAGGRAVLLRLQQLGLSLLELAGLNVLDRFVVERVPLRLGRERDDEQSGRHRCQGDANPRHGYRLFFKSSSTTGSTLNPGICTDTVRCSPSPSLTSSSVGFVSPPFSAFNVYAPAGRVMTNGVTIGSSGT